jgi:hypothetical protein
MPKVRLNDLSRELEVKSRAILDALPLVGVTEKKTHSSSIEEYEADKVRAHFRVQESAKAGTARISRGTEEIKTRIDLSHIIRPGDVLRSITQQRAVLSPASRQSAQAPQTPQPRLIVPQTGPRPLHEVPSTPPRVTVPAPTKAAVTTPPPSWAGDGAQSIAQPLGELSFMRDEELRRIARRDYAELRKVAGIGAVKSRFILMGAVLEAMLLDALLPCGREAGTTRAAAREKARKLDQWSLASLIDAAVELGFVKRAVKNLSHNVRDFRNLIHPAFEKRTGYEVRKDEADILELVLRLVMQDLCDEFGRKNIP